MNIDVLTSTKLGVIPYRYLADYHSYLDGSWRPPCLVQCKGYRLVWNEDLWYLKEWQMPLLKWQLILEYKGNSKFWINNNLPISSCMTFRNVTTSVKIVMHFLVINVFTKNSYIYHISIDILFSSDALITNSRFQMLHAKILRE